MDRHRDSRSYKNHVGRLSGLWPGTTYLDFYLRSPDYNQALETPVTFLDLAHGGGPLDPEGCTYPGFDNFIGDYNRSRGTHKLIVVEDPSPIVVATLGGSLQIEVQFWGDLLVGPSWFDEGKVSPGPDSSKVDNDHFTPFRDNSLYDQLWPLPSIRQNHRYKCLRVVVLKEDPAPSPLTESHPLDPNTRRCPPLGAHAKPMRYVVGMWTNQQNRPTTATPWIGKFDYQLPLPLGILSNAFWYRTCCAKHRKVPYGIVHLPRNS